MADTLRTRPGSQWDWRDATLPLALALVAVAGLVLWSMSDSLHPYMHLTPPADGGHHAHHGVPVRPDPVTVVGLFSAAWLAMTVAHMLPTMVPLLGAFRRAAARRRWRGGLLAAVIGGFLLVWAVAGVVVAVVHLRTISLIESYSLQRHTPLLLSVVLAVAGGYQLSRYVDTCLRACRSPLSLLARRWHGGDHAGRQAFAVGVDYGRYCLGCCAALMVVMFVAGAASHAWMVLFALLGVVQKGTRWGRSLPRPLGVGFLLAALGVAIAHAAGP
jgi:predicted metal-binding membrane protein